MSGNRIILGSRGSSLALAQSRQVAQFLMDSFAGLNVDIRIIKTQGDKLQEASLVKAGGKGLFTKEIEDELLAGNIDFAVHSLKDLPTRLAPGLALGAISSRADVRDAWVQAQGLPLSGLASGASIGTSSPRRKVQILRLRPDVRVVDFRGNVDTRLVKIRRGEVQGGVLAAAGLQRLGRLDEATAFFAPEQVLPAPGQGFLGIECREGDTRVLAFLVKLNDAKAGQEAAAERGFLDGLGGGCQLPVAAYAKSEGQLIKMKALVADLHAQHFMEDEISGPLEQADLLGAKLAERLLAKGARALLGPSSDSAGTRES